MVTVIGGGVSGLTTAVALRLAGADANVVAADDPSSTVSWVAAAIWTIPDLAGAQPAQRWALRSREAFAEIAESDGSGASKLFHLELFRSDPGPTWWETTPWVTRLENPPAGYEAALGIDGFIIEPPVYLSWLEHRLEDLGGTVTRRHIARLAEIEGLVVNCAGLGAGPLADDDRLYPIRGQVVAVLSPGIDRGVADESDPDRISYIYPRSAEVILGGTRQLGNTSTVPDPVETDRILADARQLDPRLAEATILETRVGLRPGREHVRVERERVDGQVVVHNYGHGGHGYLLSWGCADDVVTLVRSALA